MDHKHGCKADPVCSAIHLRLQVKVQCRVREPAASGVLGAGKVLWQTKPNEPLEFKMGAGAVPLGAHVCVVCGTHGCTSLQSCGLGRCGGCSCTRQGNEFDLASDAKECRQTRQGGRLHLGVDQGGFACLRMGGHTSCRATSHM